jgi:hypothetical protein
MATAQDHPPQPEVAGRHPERPRFTVGITSRRNSIADGTVEIHKSVANDLSRRGHVRIHTSGVPPWTTLRLGVRKVGAEPGIVVLNPRTASELRVNDGDVVDLEFIQDPRIVRQRIARMLVLVIGVAAVLLEIAPASWGAFTWVIAGLAILAAIGQALLV